MRIRHRASSDEESPRLQMSSMIDVVFLLLIFFVMTFQITAMEGDFEITSARPGAEGHVEPDPLPQPFHVRLSADSDGNLAGVRFDNRALENIDGLRGLAKSVTSEYTAVGGNADDLSVTLRCDSHLKYEHAIEAITALRGELNEAGEIQPLISNVQFLAQ